MGRFHIMVEKCVCFPVPPSSAEDKYAWIYASTNTVHLHVLVLS